MLSLEIRLGLLYFAQDAQVAHWMCQCAIYAQHLHKILSQCARFAQDCTYFPSAQYMRKICTRLYFFPQCAIYAQDLDKIIIISPMRNICARFARDFTFSPMRNICARLYLFLQCAIYAQDCTFLPNVQRLQALLEEICHISHICSKSRMVFTS